MFTNHPVSLQGNSSPYENPSVDCVIDGFGSLKHDFSGVFPKSHAQSIAIVVAGHPNQGFEVVVFSLWLKCQESQVQHGGPGGHRRPQKKQNGTHNGKGVQKTYTPSMGFCGLGVWWLRRSKQKPLNLAASIRWQQMARHHAWKKKRFFVEMKICSTQIFQVRYI